MKTTSIFLFCIVWSSIAFGQAYPTTTFTSLSQHSVYVEAGGPGLYGSLNYELQLTDKPQFGLRAGLGYYNDRANYLTIPLGANYLFTLEEEKSYIEMGLGVTFARADGKLRGASTNPDASHFTSYIPSIGYRRHTYDEWIWRIMLTPIINNFGLSPWLGVSFGKRF